MHSKRFRSRTEATASVMGVILLVAVTVITASVVATFAVDLGEQTSDATPRASFEFTYHPNANDHYTWFGETLNITHDGGDTIEAGNLYVKGAEDVDGDGSFSTLDDMHNNYYFGGETSDVTAGDSVTVNVKPDSTIRIVYRTAEGDTSTTLATWEGPEA